MKLELIPIEKIPLIDENDNIGEIIVKNDSDIQNNDIYVIASTIVAKSQGRIFKLEDMVPTKEAINIAKNNKKDPRLVEAILKESTELIISTPFLLVKTKNGNICINAGIDGSNVKNENYIYLPKNPDNEAKKIGKYIEENKKINISIIITDTNGRPFRNGQTAVAIGVYGINPIYSWIGKEDLFNHILEVSEEAIVDEIASAANLIMGEGNNGYPIVKIRGLKLYTKEYKPISSLYRKEEKDMIVKVLKQK